MQSFVKLLLNSLYAEQIRKDIEENFACKSEYWMQLEFDDRVKDYWKKSSLNFIVKNIDDKGMEDLLKNLTHAVNGFYTNDLFYTDTDSFYIEKSLG